VLESRLRRDLAGWDFGVVLICSCEVMRGGSGVGTEEQRVRDCAMPGLGGGGAARLALRLDGTAAPIWVVPTRIGAGRVLKAADCAAGGGSGEGRWAGGGRDRALAGR